jgi:hypothetical protein
MAFSSWIIDPTDAHADTMNLVPGYYVARLGRGQPYVMVHARVKIVRDESGDVMQDVEYSLKIDNDFVLDWNKRFPDGLTGDPVTKEEYRRMMADQAWLQENWGVRPGEKVDLTALPPVPPPG